MSLTEIYFLSRTNKTLIRGATLIHGMTRALRQYRQDIYDRGGEPPIPSRSGNKFQRHCGFRCCVYGLPSLYLKSL